MEKILIQTCYFNFLFKILCSEKYSVKKCVHVVLGRRKWSKFYKKKKMNTVNFTLPQGSNSTQCGTKVRLMCLYSL